MKRFSVYSPLPYHEPGAYPVSPFVHIAAAGPLGDAARLILTPQLATDREIDYQVDRLIAELEVVRKTAKVELRQRLKATLTRADA